jgi:hypothetical protein
VLLEQVFRDEWGRVLAADRLPRRLRPRRGSRPGVVRDRGRTVAPRGDARQPARLARDHGAQPRDRPHPPRSHPRCEDPLARHARSRGGRIGRDDHPRRAARAHLHLVPPVARSRCPGRAHPADARRAEDRGDRPHLPRPRGDDGQAARPSQAQDQGRGHPVPRPSASRASRPPRCGARRRLPDLQRGLRRPRRAGRGGDPARACARRADARRAGGAGVAGADADQRRPQQGALRRRRGRTPARPGPFPLGRRPDRRGAGRS